MPRVPRPTDHTTLPRARHWSDDAACVGVETSVFFSGKGGVPAALDAAYAKTFCNQCPARDACLAHALTHREDYGVWGGLDEGERAELLRQARRAAEKQRRQERERAKADATTAA
ncbi:WhiB family transcriptional regulator [Streptomyces sp. ITFR-6]|uniref:WhiB family transcriptional regulator n=1 Tax=Streptomyces sp. ITFR-6 TaxID=3075197 RepID=UPI00288C2768|nr:WhiB family transcriptional regulator [Streptomyces sp. ITFR-6]WNI31459.1 WhiB family transcriptional regulator [Streptomyces sp. ITFR-6]